MKIKKRKKKIKKNIASAIVLNSKRSPEARNFGCVKESVIGL
jgi:hypothetical protein